jgi:hypothetical protein
MMNAVVTGAAYGEEEGRIGEARLPSTPAMMDVARGRVIAHFALRIHSQIFFAND